MKKYIFYVIISLLSINCDTNFHSNKEKEIVDNSPRETKKTELIIPQKTIQRDSLPNVDIRKFLENPINRKEYFNLKMGANSLGFSDKGNYYKPNYKGFYYQYFLFRQFGERGLNIRTYIRGSDIKWYNKNDEILIEIIMFKEDKDLGKFDLINRTRDEIITAYGGPDYENSAKLIYWSSHNCLILNKSNADEIKRMRYSKVNQTIKTLEDIPTDIRSFGRGY